jgi:beta-galactosidase
VILWSIGNEIKEQRDDQIGHQETITRQLSDLVRSLDKTRLITAANDYISTSNHLYKSNALDIFGINYHHDEWNIFIKTFRIKFSFLLKQLQL